MAYNEAFAVFCFYLAQHLHNLIIPDHTKIGWCRIQ